jgi:large subunit ribosomal protein L2
MKNYKPITPSRRSMQGIDYRQILTKKKKPEKSLIFGTKKSGGRNSMGRITVRHKGGGHKRLLRKVDFKFEKKNIPAIVSSIEYDPSRSGFVTLIVYRDGEKRYMLAPSSLRVGDEIIISENANIKPGNRMPLSKIPVGAFVYNIELKPGGGAKLARSAGNFTEVLAKDDGFTHLKLPSGEIRKVSEKSWASIGKVSNEEHKLITIGKAGRSRWKGIRPTVRGSAMNPVDHPYGGGEGRAPQGTKRPKNKWGKGVRGVKTRKRKKYSDKHIIQRRIKKKRK